LLKEKQSREKTRIWLKNFVPSNIKKKIFFSKVNYPNVLFHIFPLLFANVLVRLYFFPLILFGPGKQS
jgi:hypothetical protein